MMEKIKAGEITEQTGDYMLRATAADDGRGHDGVDDESGQ